MGHKTHGNRLARWLTVLTMTLTACNAGVEDEETPLPPGREPTRVGLSSSCSGLMPGSPSEPWFEDERFTEDDEATCGLGPSDGMGHIPISLHDSTLGTTYWNVMQLEPGRGRGQFDYHDRAALVPLHDGFISVDASPTVGGPHLKSWAAGGALRSDTVLRTSSLPRPIPDFGQGALVSFVDDGGLLVVQRFVSEGTPRSEPAEVAALVHPPAWMASGVNSERDTLILFDGEAAGLAPFHIAGRWLSATGIPRTALFDLGALSVSTPDPDGPTLYPLHDGSLVLQWAGAWVLRVEARAEESAPIPSWLASHPDMRPIWIREGRGYALVPSEGRVVPVCEQHLRIHAQDGTACGNVTLTVDHRPCVTGRLEVGLDGTVLQRSPRTHCQGQRCTCPLRGWPGLLR